MLIFTILFMEILSGAEVDIFVPSFPEIQDKFLLSPFMVEFTLSSNFITYCLSAIFVGNLSDKYGRKQIIIYSLIIFIIGSIFCSFSQEFWHLITGRIIQGIGAAGIATLPFLIISDLFNEKKQQQLIGYLNGMITLAMAFAPIIGSYISIYFGWRGNFIALLIMALISLLLGIIYIPKSKTNDKISISLKEYLPIFKIKIIWYFIGAICLLIIPYWSFIGISPIMFIDGLGINIKHYGFYQGSIIFCFALVSISSGYLINKFGEKITFNLSIISLSFFSIISLILGVIKTREPIIITSIMILYAMSLVIPVNKMWVSSMAINPEIKGKIAALMIACRLILTGVGIQLVSYFYEGGFFVIGVYMSIITFIAIIIITLLLKKVDIFANKD